MNKKLTDDYNFVRQFDCDAAEVYIDIKHYCFSLADVSKYKGVPIDEARTLYKTAKQMIANRDEAWMNGLSNRSKLAIIASGKYKSFKQLYKDVMENNTDLEDIPNIGHKASIEIHGWLIKRTLSKEG